MKQRIQNVEDLGRVVRGVRKSQGIRQDDFAGIVGVSEGFLGKVESGAGSVQWGLVFAVLEELGVRLEVDMPGEVVGCGYGR